MGFPVCVESKHISHLSKKKILTQDIVPEWQIECLFKLRYI